MRLAFAFFFLFSSLTLSLSLSIFFFFGHSCIEVHFADRFDTPFHPLHLSGVFATIFFGVYASRDRVMAQGTLFADLLLVVELASDMGPRMKLTMPRI